MASTPSRLSSVSTLLRNTSHTTLRSNRSSVAQIASVSAEGRDLPVADGEIYIVNMTTTSGDTLCVRYATDGKLLAAGEGSAIRVLKTTSLHTVNVLQDDHHNGAVTCIRFLDESKLLASYVDGFVRLWDAKTGEQFGHMDEGRQTLGLALSPDGSKFVCLGDDAAVNVYDVATLQPISTHSHSGFYWEVDGHNNRTFSGAFHPTQADEVVTGGWDDLIHFWDLRLPNSVRHVGPAHICGTESIDISKDGKQVLTASWSQSQQLQMWDYNTAELITTIEPDSTPSWLYAARFLGDSLLCCGGSDPPIFRLVHLGQKATTGMITNLQSGVFSVDCGMIGARFPPNPQLNQGRMNIPVSKSGVPRVAFCLENKVIEVEFQ